MGMRQEDGNQGERDYRARHEDVPAFDVIGFTKIVRSGGELYEEARNDGRWQVLKSIAGDAKTTYGVATVDKDCSKGSYRYTLGVKAPVDQSRDTGLYDDLFSIHIARSGWIILSLEHFGAQYGDFWRDDPYKLVNRLGWVFDSAVGLHIDAFPPSYASDHDAMEFMMPVRPARESPGR